MPFRDCRRARKAQASPRRSHSFISTPLQRSPSAKRRSCTANTSKNQIIMNHTPIYITRDDHFKLRLLVTTALYSNASAALPKLREELDSAATPAGVITMDSTVEFEDIGTGEVEECTITFLDRADRHCTHRLWSTRGGVRKLKIRRLTAPSPETFVTAAAFADAR
jgi:regulator of nucleoside diphosphate kinase